MKPQTRVAARGHLKPASRQRPKIAGVKSRRASEVQLCLGGVCKRSRGARAERPKRCQKKSAGTADILAKQPCNGASTCQKGGNGSLEAARRLAKNACGSCRKHEGSASRVSVEVNSGELRFASSNMLRIKNRYEIDLTTNFFDRCATQPT